MPRWDEAQICTACYVSEYFFYSLYTLLVILSFCKSEQEREGDIKKGDIERDERREQEGRCHSGSKVAYAPGPHHSVVS